MQSLEQRERQKVRSVPLSLSCRAFEDEKKARMGVVECAKHELLQPFNVLYEKEGESVGVGGLQESKMAGRATSGPLRGSDQTGSLCSHVPAGWCCADTCSQ